MREEPPPPSSSEETLYIVTQAHNLDYISSTVYLTLASTEQEAIIQCMEYTDLAVEYDPDDTVREARYYAEVERLRSLSLYDIEQDDRENGNIWSAETFKMPTFDTHNRVVQIAKLDSD